MIVEILPTAFAQWSCRTRVLWRASFGLARARHTARHTLTYRGSAGLFLLVGTLLQSGICIGTQSARQTFGARVTRVRVDAIVTAEDGSFISDLDADDFALYEDEVKQDILSVQFVDLGATRVNELRPPADEFAEHYGAPVSSPVPTAPEALEPSGMLNGRVADLSAVVYLLELTYLDETALARFRRAWQMQIKNMETSPIPRAAYMIDRLGALRELAPLSADPKLLLQGTEQLWDVPLFSFPPVDPSEFYDHDEGFVLLERFCDALGTLPGRKELVWVSPGHSLGTPFHKNRRMWRQMEKLHRAANSANVSIYGIDPTSSLHVPGNFFREAFDVARRSSSFDETGQIARQIESATERELSGQSLRDILVLSARATGGMSYISWGDIDRVLDSVDRDIQRYYLITYAPPPPDGDGEYHRLRVEVQRRGATIRFRQGYVDYGEEQRRTREVESALMLPGMIRGLPLRVTTSGSIAREGIPLTLLEIEGELPEANDTAARLGNGVALEITGVAIEHDSDRQFRTSRSVSWHEISQRPGPDKGRETFLILQAWPLEPGDYDVRVVVRNVETGALSVARTQVSVAQ